MKTKKLTPRELREIIAAHEARFTIIQSADAIPVIIDHRYPLTETTTTSIKCDTTHTAAKAPQTKKEKPTMETKTPREITYPEKVLAELPHGTTVYTILRHVSRSGMTRHIDAYVVHDGGLLWVTPAIRDLCGYRQTHTAKHGHYSLVVNGCGMDMGFEVVYQLGRVSQNDGYFYRHQWL